MYPPLTSGRSFESTTALGIRPGAKGGEEKTGCGSCLCRGRPTSSGASHLRDARPYGHESPKGSPGRAKSGRPPQGCPAALVAKRSPCHQDLGVELVGVVGDEDLDLLLLLGAGQGLEALAHDVVESDLLGDESLGRDLALAQEFDDVIEVVAVVADGATELLLGDDDCVEVEVDALLPDGGDHHGAAVVDGCDLEVETGLATGALEGDVGSEVVGALHDLGDHVALAGVEDDVGTGVLGVLLTDGLALDHDDLACAHRLEALEGRESDGAGSRDDGAHARLEVAGAQRVVAHGDGLDESGLVIGEVVGDLVHELVAEGGEVREAAALAREPMEAEVLAEVRVAGKTCGAGVVAHDGLDHDAVTRLDVGDALADLDDLAGELVTHDDRCGFAGDGVGCAHGDEDRSHEILVQVRTTDAAPMELDLDIVGVIDLTLWNILDADVSRLVPTCCLHAKTPSLCTGGLMPRAAVRECTGAS